MSTANTSAIDNIGQTGAPVYLPGGTEVAASDTTNPGGLWAGSLLHAIDTDLNNVVQDVLVWTGTEFHGQGLGGNQLGTSDPSLGSSQATNQGWVIDVNPGSNFLDFPLYGISQVLTVPGSAVPEPSTFGTLAVGVGIALAYGRCRRRWKQGTPRRT